MNTDKQSGLLQLRMAKVGSNPAKVRTIAKRFELGTTLFNKQGERVVSISSNGVQTRVSKPLDLPKHLARRKRISQTEFAQGVNKALDVALLQSSFKKVQPKQGAKRSVYVKPDMSGFAAWNETQKSFRALK